MENFRRWKWVLGGFVQKEKGRAGRIGPIIPFKVKPYLGDFKLVPDERIIWKKEEIFVSVEMSL